MATFTLVFHPFNQDGTISDTEVRFEGFEKREDAVEAFTAAIATGKFASGRIEARP